MSFEKSQCFQWSFAVQSGVVDVDLNFRNESQCPQWSLAMQGQVIRLAGAVDAVAMPAIVFRNAGAPAASRRPRLHVKALPVYTLGARFVGTGSAIFAPGAPLGSC